MSYNEADILNLKRARMRMTLQQPFWAALMLSTPMVIEPDLEAKTGCRTACTDMKSVFYNPDFMKHLTEGQCRTVIAHELAHIMLKHGFRLEGRDPELWFQACDYAVNLMLVDCGFDPLPRDCAPGFGGWLLSDKFKGMSADQIYELLKRERDKNGGGQAKNLSGAVGGRDLIPPPGTPEERKQLERQVTAAVARAASAGRMAGKLPGAVQEMVDAALYPSLPWQELLHRFMTITSRDNESWMRRNRRYPDLCLPGRDGRRMGEVVYIGDTSGSVSREDLCRVANEVGYIVEAIKPERTRLVWADTKVQHEQVFEAGEVVKPEPKGRGGTDMRVPMAHVSKYNPIVVVLHTDGETPWPDVPPAYPFIVVCTTTVNVPFGDVVRFK